MSQYRIGTAAVTNGSVAVTGTGTTWLANTQAGNVFSVVGSGVPYVVGSVNSNTSITLASPYAGATAAAASYAITTSYTPNLGLSYPQNGDIDTATILMRAMLLIDQAITAVNATINATSTTSLTPAVGSTTFTTQTGKQFAYPQYIIAQSASNPANFMIGQVTAYNTVLGSLTVNVTTSSGSTACADWQISLTGMPARFSDKETPAGAINGTNKTFTLAHTPNPVASCMGYVRPGGVGAFLPMMKDIDFTLTGNTVTTTNAFPTGSNLFFFYRY